MERNNSVDDKRDNTTVVSSEPAGDTLNLLKRIPLTKEYAPRIEWLWNHISTQEYAFDDLTRGNSQFWINKFGRPDCEHFEFGDEGYVLVAGITPKVNAEIHFVTWGKPAINQVLSAAKELIAYLFKKYDLNRITALCPNNNQQAIRFAVMLRFKFEGEIRKCFLFHGQYYNMSVYGLLREEFEKREVVQ